MTWAALDWSLGLYAGCVCAETCYSEMSEPNTVEC